MKAVHEYNKRGGNYRASNLGYTKIWYAIKLVRYRILVKINEKEKSQLNERD